MRTSPPTLKGATIGNAAGEITWTVFSDTSEKLTGYASTSVVRSLNSDGFASGDLRSLTIDSNGIINGVYTNGEVVEMAQISLANFLGSIRSQEERELFRGDDRVRKSHSEPGRNRWPWRNPVQLP